MVDSVTQDVIDAINAYASWTTEPAYKIVVTSTRDTLSQALESGSTGTLLFFPPNVSDSYTAGGGAVEDNEKPDAEEPVDNEDIDNTDDSDDSDNEEDVVDNEEDLVDDNNELSMLKEQNKILVEQNKTLMVMMEKLTKGKDDNKETIVETEIDPFESEDFDNLAKVMDWDDEDKIAQKNFMKLVFSHYINKAVTKSQKSIPEIIYKTIQIGIMEITFELIA